MLKGGRSFLIFLLLLSFVGFVKADYNITGTRSCENYAVSCSSYNNNFIFDNNSHVQAVSGTIDISFISEPTYVDSGTFPLTKDCQTQSWFDLSGASFFTGTYYLHNFDEVNIRNDTCKNNSVDITGFCNGLNGDSEFESDLYQFSGLGCSGSPIFFNENVCAGIGGVASNTGDSFKLAVKGFDIEYNKSLSSKNGDSFNTAVTCNGDGYFTRLKGSVSAPSTNTMVLNSTSDNCVSSSQVCTSFTSAENSSLQYGFGCSPDEIFTNQDCNDNSCTATCVGSATSPIFSVQENTNFNNIETSCFDNTDEDSITNALNCAKDEIIIPFFKMIVLPMVLFILIIGVAYIFVGALLGATGRH